MNKNQVTEKALRDVFQTTSYITLGSKDEPLEYGKKKEVRSSERGKQFMTQPAKIGSTPDVLFEKAWPWVSDGDAYVDHPKCKGSQTQRVKGFLASDFTKRDEYNNTFRSEQYRHQLKSEDEITKKSLKANAEKMAELKKKYDSAVDRHSRYEGPKYLYDVGKSAATPHCIKCHKEAFYCPHRIAYGTNNPELEKDKGNLKTASDEIGSTAKEFKGKPQHARKPVVRDTFYRTKNVAFPNKTTTNFINQANSLD